MLNQRLLCSIVWLIQVNTNLIGDILSFKKWIKNKAVTWCRGYAEKQNKYVQKIIPEIKEMQFFSSLLDEQQIQTV